MKKKLMKGLALALSLTLAMGTFASCGGGDKGGDTSGKTDITVAIGADYETLHPSDTSTSAENTLSCQIYDTLYLEDYEDPSVLVPHVAEKWEVSDDGLCYTYYLNKKATFHDGTPVTAEDVGFSLDLYKESEYQGAVVDGMDHYEIVDDHTIKVYTTHPYAPFLHSLADMYIASKKYHDSVDAETFEQKPLGCGPYKWVSHALADNVVLEAYDDYYMGAPSIKKITFKVLGDVTAKGMAIQTGEVDFAEVDSSILSSLKDAEGVKTMEADQTTFAFVAMNTEKEPYNNVKFRQAINYAMDREAIVDAVLDGLGHPNSNLLTPTRNGYSDKQIQYNYDVEKAKALLKEAGVKEGTDLGKMYVAESYKKLGTMVQGYLADIGLNVTIEILEFNAYLDKLSQGDFGITALQMSLEGDTQQVSMAVTTEYIGMANNSRYSSKEIDDMYAKAATIVDEAERTKLYEEIFAKIQEDAPYAVLYNPTMLFAANENLNVHPLPLEGTYYIYDFSW